MELPDIFPVFDPSTFKHAQLHLPFSSLIISLELNFEPPGTTFWSNSRLICKLSSVCQLLRSSFSFTVYSHLIYLTNQSHFCEREEVLPAVYVTNISHRQCKWSAVWDFQEFQVDYQEMKVRMSCVGLRNLLQGLSFSVKYYSKHNHLQTICLYSKIQQKKCHILDCSESTCTHKTLPTGSILPWRLFSCKVRCLSIELMSTTTLARIKETSHIFQMSRKHICPKGFEAGG